MAILYEIGFLFSKPKTQEAQARRADSRELLDRTSKLAILENIIRLHLPWLYAMQAEDLAHGAGESTLRHVWRALHEDYQGVLFHSVLQLRPYVL